MTSPTVGLKGLSMLVLLVRLDPSFALWFDRHGGAGMLTRLSIDYAFRPRLRIRLTLGGFTFPRKPWAYGEQDFHLLYRYSTLHIHFLTLQ